MKKKDLPIDVLKILEKYVSAFGKKYVRVDDKNCILNFNDINNETDFNFRLIEYKDGKFLINYKPYTRSTIDSQSFWINISQLDQQFNSWLNLLSEFHETKSIFDDPILSSFENEFYSEFEIIDEDKDKPLENDKILLLYDFLENLSVKLEHRKTEINTEKINDIQDNIILLQENLTNSTRQEIARKISKIFAKIKKLGVKYFKDFITEGTKQLISEGIKQLIQHGSTFIP